MLFYISILAISLVLSTIIRPSHSEKSKLLYVVVVFLMLIGVAACRSYEVGVDTEQFVRAYMRIGMEGVSAFQVERYEPGFIALCLLLNQVSGNYQLLLVVASVITYAPIGYAIYRLSEDATLSCYLFITMNIFTGYLNVMRQGLCIALVVIALFFLIKRNNIGFVICLLASSLFHAYSLIVLVLLPLSRIGFKPKYLIIYLAVALTVVLSFNMVLDLAQIILRREEVYNSAYMSSNYFGALIQALFIAAVALLVVNYLEIGKRRGVSDKRMAAVYQHAVMIWLLFQLAATQAEIFGRLGYYFEVFSILSIPYALKVPEQKEKNLLLLVTCVMTLAYFLVVGITRPEWQGVIPYVADFSNIKALFGV